MILEILDELLGSSNIMNAVQNLGIPVVSFLILILYMMKKDEDRQDKTDARYTELVNNFVDTTRTITKEHADALDKMTSELKNIATKEQNIIDKVCDVKEGVKDIKDDIRELRK